MKLSTRSRYGLRLMLALGVNEKKSPVYLKEIAGSEGISEKYLSQIIMILKASGLVSTFRGAHGGYILGRPAERIKLIDIIEPLEGDMCLVDCVKIPEICEKAGDCLTRDVWKEMSSLLVNYLENCSLEDLIKKYRDKQNVTQDALCYSI